MAGKSKAAGSKDNPTINLPVRLPLEIWQRLKEDADYNRRSMNSEVIFLCEQGLKISDEAKAA